MKDDPQGPRGATTAPRWRIRELERNSLTDRNAFRALNLAWIEQYFAVEPRDRFELDDPEAHILEPGGRIFLAELDADGGVAIVGACALMVGDGAFKLAKMAVDPVARGMGIGRALAEAVIDRARALGATEVELYSNTVLVPAISLYRSLGFVEVPLPHNDFRRANIKMVLPL
ncbi:MAG TPA: GNAT family N-acetyltransferase [Gemmatimonadaceae bacterium]|nr:GNAT family N-acetyltransferase [Gemmatimonadaceae bacterium]